MADLKDLVAAVTGGASGIGRACALALGAAGARVILGDLDGPGAEQAASEAAQPALGCALDVTDRPAVARWLDLAISTWGRLDILVHSAGICPLAGFESLTDTEWDRVLHTNLHGAFIVSQEAFRRMRPAGGRIIHIASMAGETGGIMVGAHYAASKGGMIALARCIARAGAPHGILCNCVSPGTTDTQMTRGWTRDMRKGMAERSPLGRLATAEDVAGAVRWLAGPAAAYVTGQVIRVNGGMYM